MNADRRLLLDYITDWFAMVREGLGRFLASPTVDDRDESAPSTDRDFDGWVSNDPMVTLNPASRYGDDATGFLAGSEPENPELGRTDD